LDHKDDKLNGRKKLSLGRGEENQSFKKRVALTGQKKYSTRTGGQFKESPAEKLNG